MLLNMITYYLQTHYKQCVAKHKRGKFVPSTSWTDQSKWQIGADSGLETCADLPLHKHLLAFLNFYGVKFS